MRFTAAETAQMLQGQVLGDSATVITGFAPADRAQPGDLTFAENELYFARAAQSAAVAIMVDADYKCEGKTLIRVANARVGFAKALAIFFPEAAFAPGVHPTAVVAASAQVDPTAHVGPYCVVGEHARLGARVVLEGHDFVGAQCSLGEEARLFPGVTLYPRTQLGQRVRLHSGVVIGADGFGYVFDEGIHRKIPQIGWVVIHDDVEIGANATVDRGALGPTIIGRGTKIDNLVQIGHNVIVGEHCLLVAQVGVAGSTRLGNHVTLAGQVGVAGHLKLGHRVTVAAQSGVMNSIPDGEKWMGAPARPSQQMKRQFIAQERLPELLRTAAALERRLAALESLAPRPVPTALPQPPGPATDERPA
jgi:UDP-3-O-[3-hydroxymyristoyl] glucosamine N-acyltransferase